MCAEQEREWAVQGSGVSVFSVQSWSMMEKRSGTDNAVKAKASSGQSGPHKASRTHQELHRELLLAHRGGLMLSSRTELQKVLESRRREQSDREDEGQRNPLKDVLLKRQQKQLETEKHEEEKVQEEAQLMEFVRVRQNLRKIHTVIHYKTSHS